MEKSFKTTGVCARQIDFEIENGILKKVLFYAGCSGNLQGISSLVEGMKAEDVIKKFEGIRCGNKGTSCPDQLAKALKESLGVSKK